MAESVIPDHLKYPTLGLVSSFVFKLEDSKGHVHRFNCGMFILKCTLGFRALDLELSYAIVECLGTESLTELISTIAQRLGDDFDVSKSPHIMVISFAPKCRLVIGIK